MPSAEHESPIVVAKLAPDFIARLMATMFGVELPPYEFAAPHATDVQVLNPTTYHADGMLLYYDPARTPLAAVVLEVQRSQRREKLRMWKLYVAHLEAEKDVTATLLVYCPDKTDAAWYRARLDEDRSSLRARPLIFSRDDVPVVVDVDAARADPVMAVFSVICHGRQDVVDEQFAALAEALKALGPDQWFSYYDAVLGGLPVAARARWEAFMTTTAGNEFISEELRNLLERGRKLGAAEGKAEGKAEGEARAVLRVLQRRGVAVPADVRDRILACTDLGQLDVWLDRAITATGAAEVIEP